MRIAISLIMLAGLASGPAVSGQAAAAPTTREVLALEGRWARALMERNETAFGSLLAEDLRHIGFEAQVVGKREYMAFFASGDWKYSEYSLVDPQVAVEGCTAIVTGRVQRRIVVNGKETAGVFAFTHVWGKRGLDWQVIASHVTASP